MPDPLISSSDVELRTHVERVLEAQYELEQEIGRGGMGIVYLARDKRLKRQVAIKLLPPELAFRGEIRSRFLREAETAAQLNHPNIVPIYSVDEREGLVYFVMAYVHGQNLALMLHERGVLPATDVRRIVQEVAEALAYAHARNVIHRDIKPDNILISSEDDGRAMVTDFGIARAVIDGADSRLTATGMAIGTPAFMSPEQSMGEREIDGRSDLYSLGVVAYQMLAGELPFIATSTPAMLVKHLSETPRPITDRRPDLPPDLARAVMMLLEKDPSNRFPSAQALAVALESGTVPDPISAPAAARPLDASGIVRASRTARQELAPEAIANLAGPTPEEYARWNAPPVVKFRKKLAPFFAVSAVIVLLAIVGITNDLLGIVGLWAVYIAFQYAKLWTNDYDWRDVFRQPRDRLVFDVVAETIDDARALFDKKQRAELLERTRARRARLPMATDGRSPGAASPSASVRPVSRATFTGPYASALRDAADTRDEILRLVETLPKGDRERIGDVAGSAIALYDRIEGLALTIEDLDRNSAPDAARALEEEIAKLEAAANPLDYSGSEERVRRLAYLKRQRRAVVDVAQRREKAAARLESCRVLLQNMRYDLLRLRTGAQTSQQITLIAQQAMSLAREVDSVVYGADEVRNAVGGARVAGRGS